MAGVEPPDPARMVAGDVIAAPFAGQTGVWVTGDRVTLTLSTADGSETLAQAAMTLEDTWGLICGLSGAMDQLQKRLQAVASLVGPDGGILKKGGNGGPEN